MIAKTAGAAAIDLEGLRVGVWQRTRYPWGGTVAIDLEPAREDRFALRVRVPVWARGRPVPSDLYRYVTPAPGAVRVSVNGEPVQPLNLVDGFAVLDRRRRAGDTGSSTFRWRFAG